MLSRNRWTHSSRRRQDAGVTRWPPSSVHHTAIRENGVPRKGVILMLPDEGSRRTSTYLPAQKRPTFLGYLFASFLRYFRSLKHGPFLRRLLARQRESLLPFRSVQN